MSDRETKTPAPVPTRPSGITLAQYIRRRNGVALGAPRSLPNMLHRAFGAPSFAVFWQYWNPLWGYALARYVHRPLRKCLPASVALLLTFVVCGGVHDLAVTLIRARASVVCTILFTLFGFGVLLGETLRIDLKGRPWWLRAAVNCLYLSICIGLAYVAKGELPQPPA